MTDESADGSIGTKDEKTRLPNSRGLENSFNSLFDQKVRLYLEALIGAEDEERPRNAQQCVAFADRIYSHASSHVGEGGVRKYRDGAGKVSMVLYDLDDFKAVNDTTTYTFADGVLKAFATDLRKSTLRPGDETARFSYDDGDVEETLQREMEAGRAGGEEFLTILDDAGVLGGKIVADNLRDDMEIVTDYDGTEELNFSAGVAEFDFRRIALGLYRDFNQHCTGDISREQIDSYLSSIDMVDRKKGAFKTLFNQAESGSKVAKAIGKGATVMYGNDVKRFLSTYKLIKSAMGNIREVYIRDGWHEKAVDVGLQLAQGADWKAVIGAEEDTRRQRIFNYMDEVLDPSEAYQNLPDDVKSEIYIALHAVDAGTYKVTRNEAQNGEKVAADIIDRLDGMRTKLGDVGLHDNPVQYQEELLDQISVELEKLRPFAEEFKRPQYNGVAGHEAHEN